MAVALSVLLAFAAAGQAFYWVGWPSVQQPPQVISGQVKVEHRDPDPPVSPPPPGGGGDDTDPPGGVPEPTTVILAGAGLAAAAGMRWVRRRKGGA